MKLYHFTGRAFLAGIAIEGLSKGDIPLDASRADNAVWLTTDAALAGVSRTL